MITTKPKKGDLLIAEPAIIGDMSFNRSIVLLADHNQEGSIGFILNKPLNYTINDLVPEVEATFKVYNGGPVEQDNLYFVHRVPDLIPDSIAISNGIYWGGKFSSLKKLLQNNILDPTEIRFFLGYSGWMEYQLLDEIETDSWFVTENDFKNIFAVENETLWKNKLLQKGGKYKLWANAPNDINLN